MGIYCIVYKTTFNCGINSMKRDIYFHLLKFCLEKQRKPFNEKIFRFIFLRVQSQFQKVNCSSTVKKNNMFIRVACSVALTTRRACFSQLIIMYNNATKFIFWYLESLLSFTSLAILSS